MAWLGVNVFAFITLFVVEPRLVKRRLHPFDLVVGECVQAGIIRVVHVIMDRINTRLGLYVCSFHCTCAGVATLHIAMH